MAGVLIVAIAFVLACAAYWLGTRRIAGVSVPLEMDTVAAPVRDAECGEQLEQCRQQSVNLDKGAEIDAVALAQARKELAQARTRIERLEQESALYQSLIDGSVRTLGLTASNLEISTPDGEPARRYRFRLTFIQRAERHAELQGFATLTVLGTQDGKLRKVGLAELSGRASDRRLPLKLIYFQTLEGDFSLPDGFDPVSVQVHAETKAGKSQRTDRTFDWHLVED